MNVKKKYKQNLTLDDLPGEQWKDIPFLDGVCLLSNYGRVKSLRRWVERLNKGGEGYWKEERILKNIVMERCVPTGKRKTWLLRMSVSYQGKRYQFTTGRLVYDLFVEKGKLEDDPDTFINYKDGNPFNVHSSNLFLVSRSHAGAKGYDLNNRTNVEYNIITKKIHRHGKSGDDIQIEKQVIKNTGNFIGQHKKDTVGNDTSTLKFDNRISAEELHTTIVTQYDLTGTKLKEYENISAAAKAVGIATKLIKHVILGKLHTTAGYYWQLGKGRKKVSIKHIEKGKRKWEESIRRPVTQYDLEGKIVKHYKSIRQAALETGISSQSIVGSLKYMGLRTAKSSFWVYGKGEKTISVPKHIKRKKQLEELYMQPVTQYTLEGKRVAVHNNLRLAAKKVNGQLGNLLPAVLGQSLSSMGFCWRLSKGGMTTNVEAIQNPSRQE